MEMKKIRKIVLTGASGFLGQHVLHSLMTQMLPASNDADNTLVYYEIFALHGGSLEGFASSVVAIPPHPQVTVTLDKLDLSKESEVKQWIASHNNESKINTSIDLCLHLAAMSAPAECQENHERAHAVNCPTALIRALAEANIPCVALSTDQVYSGCASPHYLETDKPQPVNVYGETKLAQESALAEFLAKTSVSLRSSIILGPAAPFGGAHSTFLHFCATRKGVATDYYTDECRSVVALADVVIVLKYFVVHGVTADSAGVYNMGGKDRVSRYDMALTVARRLGMDETYVIPKKKTDMPLGKVPSPLDITMDSSKLSKLIGVSSLKGLDDIVKETFSKETNSNAS